MRPGSPDPVRIPPAPPSWVPPIRPLPPWLGPAPQLAPRIVAKEAAEEAAEEAAKEAAKEAGEGATGGTTEKVDAEAVEKVDAEASEAVDWMLTAGIVTGRYGPRSRGSHD